MKFTLSNGILLDDDWGMTKTLKNHAETCGFSNFRIFKATHPDGSENYLVVNGQNPVFEHTNSEEIYCFIEREKMNRDLH